ncbi:MAG: acetyl-CoA carboxylase biotin carboxyl carrier protein subunit [Burkholderiales bacterium]|nr:acetyl-CoA carboxylase biotin carboxyl carrier protein subunit [Burkholderiales bacterium]
MPPVLATINGVVLKVAVAPGDRVAPGDELVVVESMKMEIPVVAEATGRVEAVLCAEGETVREGEPLLLIGGA